MEAVMNKERILTKAFGNIEEIEKLRVAKPYISKLESFIEKRKRENNSIKYSVLISKLERDIKEILDL